MLVTVVIVGAYVGLRALTREQPELTPESVHYLSCVANLQDADTTVVYPAALPEGWVDSSVAFGRGNPPRWRIGILTASEEYVGVVQQKTRVKDLLDTYVDSSPMPGDAASPQNSLGITSWETWTDAGGDLAYAAEIPSGPLAGETLLVYGSASAEEQQALIASLTTDPVSLPPGSPGCNTNG